VPLGLELALAPLGLELELAPVPLGLELALELALPKA
jgi:hypothetical protein